MSGRYQLYPCLASGQLASAASLDRILKFYVQEEGYEVVAYSTSLSSSDLYYDIRYLSVADVGQEEDFEAAREKAAKVGATKFILDVSHPCCCS